MIDGVLASLGSGALTQVVPGAIESETLLEAVVRILGFGLLAAATAATAAVAFRWYSAEEIPEGIAVLFGISPVAIWLNTQTALQDAIIGTTPLLDAGTAVYTIAAFAVSAIAADGGRRTGEYLARDVIATSAPQTIDDIGQLVRSAGRVTSVDLPEKIDDTDGYDPVEETTKAELAGRTFLFPRRLSREQLRERLTDRLERDHGIGHVEVTVTDEKTIDHLAIGSRPAGIGPTLAPGTVAVAIRADPAPDATPGDAVRIWKRDGDADGGGVRPLADGELRGTADDVATVAVDAGDADVLEADGTYRLVTLPGTPGAERELVSLLRAADEAVATFEISADDGLVDERVGTLPVLVLALERSGDGGDGDGSDGGGERTATVLALPDRDVRLERGDRAYVLGRPEALRRLAERSGVREESRSSARDSDPDRSTGTRRGKR